MQSFRCLHTFGPTAHRDARGPTQLSVSIAFECLQCTLDLVKRLAIVVGQCAIETRPIDQCLQRAQARRRGHRNQQWLGECCQR
jgi:hypothetical protein